MIHATKRFDDRQVDFATGKRVSPPLLDRRLCDCCGQRIVKGWIMTNGMPVGDDCEDIIVRASSDKVGLRAVDVGQFAANHKRATGWMLKPAVRGYIAQQVFA